MASDAGLNVRVCYAQRDCVWQRDLGPLPPGTTVAQALQACDFGREFPDFDVWTQGVGIYGRKVAPDTLLTDGDRVEIYRALSFDPKESRRRRAEHRRAKQAEQGRKRPPGLL